MFSNQLSAAEVERLALLMEECAEVQQVIGKILRHGFESYNPHDPARTTNRALLEKEMGDLRAVTRLLYREDDVSEGAIARACTAKTASMQQWLHHQRQPAEF
jgi:hypothetical protein